MSKETVTITIPKSHMPDLARALQDKIGERQGKLIAAYTPSAFETLKRLQDIFSEVIQKDF